MIAAILAGWLALLLVVLVVVRWVLAARRQRDVTTEEVDTLKRLVERQREDLEEHERAQHGGPVGRRRA